MSSNDNKLNPVGYTCISGRALKQIVEILEQPANDEPRKKVEYRDVTCSVELQELFSEFFPDWEESMEKAWKKAKENTLADKKRFYEDGFDD